MIRTLLSAALVAAGLGASSLPASADTAIFAGGCFWCVESDMDHVPGVTKTVSGYIGGTGNNPTYDDYSKRGFREAVEVTFDQAKISYHDLVATFLRTIDVTDNGGQFCDRGHAYSPAVYALDGSQAKAAKQAETEAGAALGQSIEVPVENAVRFWPAEAYHQDYYLGQKRVLTRFGYVKQSTAYKGYREGCGRDARVKKVWGNEAYRGVGGHS